MLAAYVSQPSTGGNLRGFAARGMTSLTERCRPPGCICISPFLRFRRVTPSRRGMYAAFLEFQQVCTVPSLRKEGILAVNSTSHSM